MTQKATPRDEKRSRNENISAILITTQYEAEARRCCDVERFLLRHHGVGDRGK